MRREIASETTDVFIVGSFLQTVPGKSYADVLAPLPTTSSLSGHPGLLPHIAVKIAELKSCSTEEVLEAAWENSVKLFFPNESGKERRARAEDPSSASTDAVAREGEGGDASTISGVGGSDTTAAVAADTAADDERTGAAAAAAAAAAAGSTGAGVEAGALGGASAGASEDTTAAKAKQTWLLQNAYIDEISKSGLSTEAKQRLVDVAIAEGVGVKEGAKDADADADQFELELPVSGGGAGGGGGTESGVQAAAAVPIYLRGAGASKSKGGRGRGRGRGRGSASAGSAVVGGGDAAGQGLVVNRAMSAAERAKAVAEWQAKDEPGGLKD